MLELNQLKNLLKKLKENLEKLFFIFQNNLTGHSARVGAGLFLLDISF